MADLQLPPGGEQHQLAMLMLAQLIAKPRAFKGMRHGRDAQFALRGVVKGRRHDQTAALTWLHRCLDSTCAAVIGLAHSQASGAVPAPSSVHSIHLAHGTRS